MSKKKYMTSDFGLAVTLKVLGFEMLGTNQNALQPRKVFFVFEKSKKIEEVAIDYLDGKLRVDPFEWHHESKALKNLLWGRKEAELSALAQKAEEYGQEKEDDKRDL